MSDYRVQFEVFEGPLDLLLHLVKKQEVDIYQVNLTRIATEFVAYLDRMRALDLEVAGEFVVMAATLVYIKSRELLPVEQQVAVEDGEEETEDPRFELIRRLVEYKKFKDAAGRLQEREEAMDGVYARRPTRPELSTPEAPARGVASVFDLVSAVSTILKRFHERTDIREIVADPYTVSEKIDHLRDLVRTRPRFRLGELFAAARSRSEVVVTFLALLELIRLKQLQAWQTGDFGEIEVTVADPTAPGATGAPDAGTLPDEGSEPEGLPPADIVTPVPVPGPGELPSATPLADPTGPQPA